MLRRGHDLILERPVSRRTLSMRQEPPRFHVPIVPELRVTAERKIEAGTGNLFDCDLGPLRDREDNLLALMSEVKR